MNSYFFAYGWLELCFVLSGVYFWSYTLYAILVITLLWVFYVWLCYLIIYFLFLKFIVVFIEIFVIYCYLCLVFLGLLPFRLALQWYLAVNSLDLS